MRGCQEQAVQAGSSVPTISELVVPVLAAHTSTTVTERLVIVPRDCKCPVFNLKMGMSGRKSYRRICVPVICPSPIRPFSFLTI